jgi:acetylornithine/succinyldiaminopimelate/putrescine aminotransferase
MDRAQRFLRVQGQTSPFPFLIDVESAQGIYIYAKSGKAYMDMIAGVAVNNIGHRHPKVIQAIQQQLDRHLHVMVYGEFIQDAQLQMAERLCALLPPALNCVYTVNSGTEANEAAIKLARRCTGRSEIVSFLGSYHGSTLGSMSVSANEVKKSAFRPLLPDVRFLPFNAMEALDQISEKTAGVIIETIQGDAGVRKPDQAFMEALRKRCDETGALLIFDEIQCGMGRTGKMFAFEHFQIVPDVLTLGKGLGGGLSIGALVSDSALLQQFTHAPMLGHITTFGGHPVNCAAASATLEVLSEEVSMEEVERLGALLENEVRKEPEILAIRRVGMLFAFDMVSSERVAKVVERCLEKGLISFWFLSHPYSFRLSPPLNISEEETQRAAEIIRLAIQETRN